MNKSILVIKTPKNCYQCPINNNHFCNMTDNCVLKYANSKPNWCPLKEAPERYDDAANDGSSLYYMSVGWNNCVDEILDSN